MRDDTPGDVRRAARGGRRPAWRRRASALLLIVPVAALLAVPLYARMQPRLLGWPFFYWYQFAWGVITIAAMALWYRIDARRRAAEEPAEPRP